MHFLNPPCSFIDLEEDKAAKPQHFSFHGASEVSLSPEVDGGKDVRQTNQSAPHAMTPLHVENKFKFWQSHVMIQSGKETQTVQECIITDMVNTFVERS